MIISVLKHSPDKACVFRICHENLSDELLDVKKSMKCLEKHMMMKVLKRTIANLLTDQVHKMLSQLKMK